MAAMYEEKTFESYFNSELDKRSSIYFPFGQVQEGRMGADSSAHSMCKELWKYLGLPESSIPIGTDLSEICEYMEVMLREEISNIPNIKVNLLFQYKRPKLIRSANGAEWHFWKKKYFRYDIYKEQQALLEEISREFGKKALVLYASPAVETIEELIRLKLSGSIIENTNFRPAADLSNHHRNTYIQAGNFSIACSDPQLLAGFDLLEEIDNASGVVDYRNTGRYVQIVRFSRVVQEAISKSNLKEAYAMRIREYELAFRNYTLIYSFVSMRVFREISGVQWLIAVA